MASPDCAISASVFHLFLDALRRHGQLTFVLADLDGHHGLADKHTGTVFLDRGNTAGEMRATSVHELRHIARPDESEEDVELATAEMLVPLRAVQDADTDEDVAAIADGLLVDPKLVRARQFLADRFDPQLFGFRRGALVAVGA